MKSLFFSKAAIAALLLFLSFSFTPSKHGTRQNTAQKDVFYYWYIDGGTVYDGWRSVSQEITSLEERYGEYVDGDPENGTVIAAGYGVKGYPHYVYASYFLYTH